MLISKEEREDLDRFFKRIRLYNSGIDKVCKIEQILAYLEIVHSRIRNYSRTRKFVIVDCCAGNCYLSFLIYYYYKHHDIRNIRIHCVDINEKLMKKAGMLAEESGFTGMKFHPCDVLDFGIDEKPDMIISLHACNSATDKMIYYGLKNSVNSILSVSCCQHDIRQNIRSTRYRGITKHKVFRERMAYMVGDSLRSLLLEMNGYDVDIIEFVSSRYTDKNILIRAFRNNGTITEKLIEDYRTIRDEFRIKPVLEKYLADFTDQNHNKYKIEK